MATVKKGDRVRMTEAFKARLRGDCTPGHHVTDVIDGAGDSCYKCSLDHIEEFGSSVGVVIGLTDYNNAKPGDPTYEYRKIGPEVDVRWAPHLRYAYHPDDLDIVS